MKKLTIKLTTNEVFTFEDTDFYWYNGAEPYFIVKTRDEKTIHCFPYSGMVHFVEEVED